MNSEPIHEPTNEQSRPDRDHSSQDLTDAQRIFATVLAQALADAWRRKWRQPTDDFPAPP